jgi:hypothetical protein
MQRAANYGIITDPVAGISEQDSFTCNHCSHVVTVMPRQRPEDLGGLCKQCMQLICPRCVDKMICEPWERKMEKIEARDRFLRSAGL